MMGHGRAILLLARPAKTPMFWESWMENVLASSKGALMDLDVLMDNANKLWIPALALLAKDA